MKRLVVVAAVASFLAACGPSGKLSGRVKVQNGDPSAVTVMLTGAVTRAAAVDASGAYAFDELPDGVYVVEAIGESTAEERLTARAQVSNGSGQVGELAFRGVGKVSGRVTSPTGSAGAQVFIAGEAIRVNVAEDGTFALDKVPSGDQTIVAVREGYEPTYAKLSVPFRAELANQVLALTEVAHGAGVISGRAYYFDRTDQTGITVKVEGTTLSAQTDADGNYTLQGAPLGYVTLIAEAQGYQPARAINVLSAAGGTLRAPDLRVSYLERRFTGYVYDYARSPDGKALLFVGMPEFDTSYYLYSLDLTGTAQATRLFRYGTVGASLTVFWQADSKRAAVQFNSSKTIYAVNLESGDVQEVTQKFFGGSVRLANERVFFLEKGDGGAAVLSVYSFDNSSKQTIEKVDAPTGACSSFWSLDRFDVSADGRAAYFAKAANGVDREVHLWNGSAQTVSGGKTLDCIGFHAGSQLLGLQVQGQVGLYNLTSGAPVTLVTANPGDLLYPTVSFTGDDQYAWFIDASSATPLLKSVPIGGGPVVTVQTGGQLYSSESVAVQPRGDQLAFRNTNGDIVVKRADGTLLKTYVGPSSGPATFRFGSEGKHFLHAFASDRLVKIANTSNHVPVTLGEAVTYQFIVSGELLSPHEKAVGLITRLPSGSFAFQLHRADDGSIVDLPFLGPGVMPSFITYSGKDTYVHLVVEGGDRIVNIDTGAVSNLQRAANATGSGAPFFTGDESRLLFAEQSNGTGRLLDAHSDDGSVHHAADLDGTIQLFAIPDSQRVVLLDGSTSGEPRGIYTFVAP